MTTHIVVTTLSLPPQTVMSLDGKGVVVSAIVKYRVRVVREYLLGVWDQVDVLKDTTLGAIREAINQTAYSDLCGNTNVESAVLKAVREETNQYGFQTFKVTLVDLGLVRSIRLIGNGAPDEAA